MVDVHVPDLDTWTYARLAVGGEPRSLATYIRDIISEVEWDDSEVHGSRSYVWCKEEDLQRIIVYPPCKILEVSNFGFVFADSQCAPGVGSLLEWADELVYTNVEPKLAGFRREECLAYAKCKDLEDEWGMTAVYDKGGGEYEVKVRWMNKEAMPHVEIEAYSHLLLRVSGLRCHQQGRKRTFSIVIDGLPISEDAYATIMLKYNWSQMPGYSGLLISGKRLCLPYDVFVFDTSTSNRRTGSWPYTGLQVDFVRRNGADGSHGSSPCTYCSRRASPRF